VAINSSEVEVSRRKNVFAREEDFLAKVASREVILEENEETDAVSDRETMGAFSRGTPGRTMAKTIVLAPEPVLKARKNRRRSARGRGGVGGERERERDGNGPPRRTVLAFLVAG